ncbi:MAG: polysaccharide biosynthesis protein [Eubacterium sp.]
MGIKKINSDKWIRILILIALDIIALQVTSYMAILVRLEFAFSLTCETYAQIIFRYSIIDVVCMLIIFTAFRLYNSVWSYAGIVEIFNVIFANIILAVSRAIGLRIMYIYVSKDMYLPKSYYFIATLFMMAATLAIRFSYRGIRWLKSRHSKKDSVNTMVIGAGDAGAMIIQEINNGNSKLNYKVKCVIDDNSNKKGKYIFGVPIIGGREKIVSAIGEYGIENIIIAMPSARREEKKAILEICKETGCQLKILPGMYQLINGELNVSKLKKVEIEDLLGREPIKLDLSIVMGYVSNKVVMVTGGGGSIGSELCRQIAAYKPKQLIIVDIYENNAYDIQQELKKKFPKLNLVVLIGSVRNTHRMNTIFEKYKPNIVYHAAAHKHVPLMEDSPNEAIKNNVFGTYKTALAAANNGVERFVLISTDKAVNPTNIMGASKRMCEMVVQMMNRKYKTEFVAVRFGNVLGSNGSVIPLFKKQIAAGGPVTVTDPNIIRYFMTIPEAVSLVLQAGAYAKGGEIFVLDMGEPVKIVDLARNLIKLSGYSENEIKIEFTGLRPGEKLYEEMLMAEEGLQSTENELIHIGQPIEFNDDEFEEQLKQLYEIANKDTDEIKSAVRKIVPTYNPKQ